MEKLNDILTNLKERFTNPLIFSFICSWLVINWPITIGLLWYDTTQIKNEGFSSIFAFIENNINKWDSLTKPLLFAISYTVLIPVIKNLIRAFYSWASKWGDSWNLSILNTGKISINKYIKLRNEYKTRTKILEDVIENENAYREGYEEVNTQLLNTQNQLNSVSQQLEDSNIYVRKIWNIDILNGLWENQFESENGKGAETVLIDNGRYMIIGEFGNRKHVFNIRNFYYDSRDEDVFFIKELVGEEKKARPITEHYNINQLRFQGKDLLIGIENGITKIRYKRKK